MSLRVAVVTQDEPFHMPAFFETFFDQLNEAIEIDSVTILDLLDDSITELATRMYGLYGLINFIRRSVEYGFRKLAARFTGSYSVANIANRHDVPVQRCQTVNDSEFVSYIKAKDIDVLLSVSAPEIFESDVLNAPTWGCVNVHTASLPKYRGLLPTFWALYHGDEEIGVTVHTMVEDIDRGKIIRQTTFSVEESDSLDDVIHRGKHVGGKVAAKALADIADRDVSLMEMEGERSYYSFPTAKHRRELQRRGRDVL